MSRAGWAALFLVTACSAAYAADAPDPLSLARLLYNQRHFDAAVAAAERARLTPGLADRADLIAARAYLERYRQSAATEDLTNARARLRRLDPLKFDPRERTEFIVGLGEALYFEESFGAAADIFESVLDRADDLTAAARERVLDWWAIAIDREAWMRPEAERLIVYQRIRDRMGDEVTARPGSSTAAYWVAAAARAQGDLQRAWDAAEAAWVRASLAVDRGAALRADIDRLMLIAIVPERARALAQPVDTVRLEWEQFKEKWKAN